MPQKKKAKDAAELSRKKGSRQSAVRGTHKDVSFSNPIAMFMPGGIVTTTSKFSHKSLQLKEDTPAAPPRRKSSRVAARSIQAHQTQTLQPITHPGSPAQPTTKSKQAAARTNLATIQGKSHIQPREIRKDLGSVDPITAPDIESGKRVRGRPKNAAGPIERTPQDSGSGSQRLPTGPSIRKAKQPAARSDQTQGESPRAQLTPVANSSSPAFSGESRDSQLVENPNLQNPTTALSREALEKHTRNTAPVDLVHHIRTIKRISGLLRAENSVDAQSFDTIVVDRQEEFNYKWGYLPPLGEEAECVLIALLENPAIARIMARIGPDDGTFRSGLEHNRNVDLEPSLDPDPCTDGINALNLGDFLPETMDQQRCHEELWRFDKIRCTRNPSEALIQRTLMINLIARHTLVHQQGTGKTQLLDFNVEEPWQCPPMPTKSVWRVHQEAAFDCNFLTQPKPDLALYFNRDSVIPDHIWKALPAPTRALACFENMNSAASRIFHFLTIEAKKAMIDIDADKAKYQCLNNASQALHNMYEFFNDAGSEHREIFFNKVRFFSLVANRKGMLVRIHRAVEIPEDAERESLILPDQPDYRLKFKFEEFVRIDGGKEYSRERVFNIFRRILKYAAEDLGKFIKAAALALAMTMRDDPAAYDTRRDDEAFYRHGQPGPKRNKISDGSLVPSSRIGRLTDVKTKLLKATLNTNRTVATSNQTMRSGVDTERPLETKALLGHSHVVKKRSSNDRDGGSPNSENSQTLRKRRKGAHGQNSKKGRN